VVLAENTRIFDTFPVIPQQSNFKCCNANYSSGKYYLFIPADVILAHLQLDLIQMTEAILWYSKFDFVRKLRARRPYHHDEKR
jgi:hypothetical protein